MPTPFSIKRLVTFAETDLAGIENDQQKGEHRKAFYGKARGAT